MAQDLIVRVDASTAGFVQQMGVAQKATQRYGAQLKLAQRAQLEYDAAVAKSGAASNEAALAQQKLGAALARTTVAEQKAAVEAQRLGEIQAASSAKAAAAAEAAAAKQAAAVRKIGTVAGSLGLAAAAGLGLAAKAASDFNASLATLAALDPSAPIDKLAAAAHNYTEIGVSASEAVAAEIELTKAGISAADIMGGALTGALNLAAAGQVDVATATEIAAQAMTQFQLAGQDVPHIADLLAAGADKALGSVQDLGEGLSYSGLTAHQLGLSVDETVAGLAEFAQAGLLGSQGGAAFQQMLLRLENPTEKSATLMSELGLSLYDAQGNFVGMESLAGQLSDKLGSLTQEQRLATLATLFGSRAVRAANVLYQDGAEGVARWQERIEESGFAARQAADKMDSLQGDVQKLSAEFSNAAVDFGQQLQPALRAITQDLTAFVGFLDDIPGPLKEAAALTLVFTAAVGAGVFVYTRAATALGSMATTLGLVGTRGATAAAGVGATTAATGALNTKMLALKGGAALAGIGLLTIASDADKVNVALGDATEAAGAAALGFSVAGPLGAAIGGGTTLLVGYVSELNKVNDALAQVKALADTNPFGFDSIIKGANDAADALDRTSASAQGRSLGFFTSLPIVSVAYDYLADSADHAADSTDEFIDRTKEVRDGFRAFSDDLKSDLSFDDIAQRLHKLGYSVKEIQDLMANRNRSAPDAIAFQTAAAAVDNWGAAAKGAAGDVKELTDAQKDAAAAVEDLTAALKEDQAVLSQRAAVREYADTLKEINEAQKKGNVTLRQANELSDQQAQQAITTANTMAAGSKTQIRFLEAARTALYKQRLEFGYTKEEARNYVNTVLDIPTSWKTETDIDTVAATAKVKALQAQYNLTPKEVRTIVTAAGAETAAAQVRALRDYINQLQSKTISIQVNQSIQTTGGFIPGGRVVYGQADGGLVRGPGGPRDDRVLRALSNGEFVQQESATRREGVGRMQALNEGRATIVPLRPGLAAGGPAHGWGKAATSSGWAQQKTVVIQQSLPNKLQLVVEGQSMTAFVRPIAEDSVYQFAAHTQNQADMG